MLKLFYLPTYTIELGVNGCLISSSASSCSSSNIITSSSGGGSGCGDGGGGGGSGGYGSGVSGGVGVSDSVIVIGSDGDTSRYGGGDSRSVISNTAKQKRKRKLNPKQNYNEAYIKLDRMMGEDTSSSEEAEQESY